MDDVIFWTRCATDELMDEKTAGDTVMENAMMRASLALLMIFSMSKQ